MHVGEATYLDLEGDDDGFVEVHAFAPGGT
jgi:hypothetical protein